MADSRITLASGSCVTWGDQGFRIGVSIFSSIVCTVFVAVEALVILLFLELDDYPLVLSLFVILCNKEGVKDSPVPAINFSS